MITVLGSSGYIGSHLAEELTRRKLEFWLPAKGNPEVFRKPLGDVIYAVGLTADFRSRPFDTVEAHVTYLSRILKEADFDSFVLLSSTRVYIDADSTAEDAVLQVRPTASDHLYNLSKLMGESLCLTIPHEKIRVARLSNVYGGRQASPSFLQSLTQQAMTTGVVTLQSDPDSAKDYLHIDDAVDLLLQIALTGKQRLYNVASGVNTTNRAITRVLESRFGAKASFRADASLLRFPLIEVSRIQKEFGFKPKPFLDKFEATLPERMDV